MTSTVDEARSSGAGVTVASGPARSPAASRRALGAIRSSLPLVGLGALAVLIAVLARRHIYPAYSWNRDEPVYLWMAEHLRDGHLTATDGGAPAFFQPWLAAARDGAFFTHFTVGWSAVLLASDLLFRTPDAAPAFGALLAVLGTYALGREVTGERSLALVAAALMTMSPILAIHGGVYLGYLFTAGLGLLFAAALLSGFRQGRAGRMILAGVLLGGVFLTRPFDAVLWGAAVSGYLVLANRRQWRRLVRGAAWFALGLLPLVVVGLVFNKLVTGGFLGFPNSAADPLDKFGFGLRRMMPEFLGVKYSVGRAVRNSMKNGFFLLIFLAGGYLGAVAAGVGLWLRRRDQRVLVLLAIMAVFPMTYFFHWGTFISSLVSRFNGPIYLMPLYGPLCILAAGTVVAVWRRRRAFGVALVLTLVAATIPAAWSRLDVNRRMSQAQAPWKESVAGLDGPVLVFVERSGPYLQFFNPYSANDPSLEGEVLYAADRGPANLDLISRLRERTPYLQRVTLADRDVTVPIQRTFPPGEFIPRERPLTPVVSLDEIRVVEAEALTVRLRARPPTRGQVAAAYIDLGDGSGPQWRPLPSGGRAVSWTVAGARLSQGDDDVLRLLSRLGTVEVGVAYGATYGEARRPAVRQLLSYRLDGSSVEVLLPGDQQRTRKSFGGRVRWYQDGSAITAGPDEPPPRDLDVDVVPVVPQA